MKMMLVLLMVSSLSLAAQNPSQENPTDVSVRTTGPAELRSPVQVPTARMPSAPKTSGVIVQAVRVRNPLKLIDPRAPRELGDGYANVVRNPISGRAEGIRFLSLSF
jgi:hypothetical protein